MAQAHKVVFAAAQPAAFSSFHIYPELQAQMEMKES